MRKFCTFFIIMLALSAPTPVYAFIPISAPSAILMDQKTGTVLFAYNEHVRNYPAGLTKMLTAIVALEYLDPQRVIVVGPEIYSIPAGALRSGHQTGEHITVHNLLRGLMIRNGNDSGAVLALQTVQAQRNNNNVPFGDAVRIFSQMMNDRARELGARNTNFVNPNGLHHDDHVTTAYDLALIARAFMEHPLLREIAGEAEFTGNSLDGYEGDLDRFEGVHTINYHWIDTNELMSGGTFNYHYATGIRSGSTPQAMDALAASAERNSVQLIAIVLASPDPGRWQDARILFDYGFATYSYHNILESRQVLETAVVTNAMLGGPGILDVLSAGDFTALLSQAQMSRLERVIMFDEEFVSDEESPYNSIMLLAPIEEDAVLGTVSYFLDGELIFEGEIQAAASIEGRSLDSDMDFYIALIRDNIFSLRALPFWMGSAGVLVGIAGMSLAIAERRRSRRSWYSGRDR